MTTKQYKELAELLQDKASTRCSVQVTDFLEQEFTNFNREKFMIACGFDKAYSYAELLDQFFAMVESQSIQL